MNAPLFAADVGVRPATPADAEAVCTIYNPFVTGTVVTFEETPVATDEMAARIAQVSRTHHWLVATAGGAVAGYAYAGPWRTRAAYREAAECSVYVAPAHARRGVARALYARLLALLRAQGIHTVIGGIALPNDASVALHERMGFAPVAHFREVGFKFGRRIDVGYWQLLL
ncbi:MAG: arsinothricin resistance N-acetyltransferase ArsN1 family B [Burkholderiales bacterium]